MIWLITSILCFFLFKRFISKVERKEEYGSNWQSIKFPLGVWILTVLCCFIPIINFIALICVELYIIGEIRSRWPNFRFKEGHNHWLNKLIDIMSKEY